MRIALDDFGAGYSSLAYLDQDPFDVIKIDRSIVGDLATSKVRRLRLEAMVVVGRAMDAKVIAEGIECSADEQALRSMQCEFGIAAWHYRRTRVVAGAPVSARIASRRR